MGNVTQLKSMSESESEMTNGVVTCRRVGLWFSRAKMVTKLKTVPNIAHRDAIALAIVKQN